MSDCTSADTGAGEPADGRTERSETQMHDVTLIEHRSRPVSYYLQPAHIPRTLWRHRELLLQLIRRGVAERYRGSALGLAWSIMLPLIMLAVYTFVFSVVFQARWGGQVSVSKTEFALTLFCGLLLFNVFSESIGAATHVVVSNVSYVKKVVFPLEVLPVVSLGAALVNGALNLLVLLLALLVFEQRLPLSLLYLPLTVLPLVLLCLGLGWFLASIGVYLRDTSQVVAVVLQMLIFLTPVFYSIEQVPEALRAVMRLNPLTVIVENARRTVMHGHPPEWGWLAGATLLGLVAMQLGYVWFMKTKRGFADVL